MATPTYETSYGVISNTQKTALTEAVTAVDAAITIIRTQEESLVETGPISSAKSLLRGTIATLESYKNSLNVEVSKYEVPQQ